MSIGAPVLQWKIHISTFGLKNHNQSRLLADSIFATDIIKEKLKRGKWVSAHQNSDYEIMQSKCTLLISPDTSTHESWKI